MDNKKRLMLAFIAAVSCMASSSTWAFYCQTYLLVDPPVLRKDTTGTVTIMNMAPSVSCAGNSLDNLRTTGGSIDPGLTARGFTGVVNINGSRFDMPAAGHYIWPYPNSSATIAAGSAPVRVTIELRRSSTGTGAWGAGVTLPAGTEIARLNIMQRSGSYWGNYSPFRFILNAPMVIPAYTCNVTNGENRRITMPNVDWKDMNQRGEGRYEGSRVPFSFNLDCDVLSTVDLAFSGTTMSGKDDVLGNRMSRPDGIGIQIFPAGSSTAIKFDNVEQRMFESTTAHETLDYEAYYYNNGTPLNGGGPVRASMTYTFSYK